LTIFRQLRDFSDHVAFYLLEYSGRPGTRRPFPARRRLPFRRASRLPTEAWQAMLMLPEAMQCTSIPMPVPPQRGRPPRKCSLRGRLKLTRGHTE
jgi:hypothetical protein